MSRIDLINTLGNEDAKTFNKCSKAYEKGRADAIDETLKIINRKIALLEERLSTETFEGRWVDEEKCQFAIEQLEFLAEQIKGGS